MSALTATVDAVGARVLLTLDWDVPSATIYRVDPDGRHVPVRGAEPAVPVAATVSLADSEAPLDVAVRYQAVATADGTTLDSAYVTVPSNGLVWLRHPGKPQLDQSIVPAEPPERSRELNATAHAAIGRRYPLTISDGRRKAATFTLKLRTRTLGEAQGLRALLDDGSALLLQAPDGMDIGSIYVQPMNVTEAWIVRYLPHTQRLWTVDMVQTDRPVGLSLTGVKQGTWAWGMANFESWAAARAVYPTWRELKAAP